MPQRAHKPVTVTLGGLEPMVRERVASGDYTSVSEVVRAGLRALQREEAALDGLLKDMVAEVLANPGEPLAHADVVAHIDQLYASYPAK